MLASARRSLGVIYRNRLSDWLDQWLFFIVFAIGAGAIVTLKLARLPQWAVTAVPVGVMGFYAVYVFASPRYRLREDRVGDNLYYLGFLYTLTSLAYSLHSFTQDEGGTQVIISNFGVALATTIVGLALRVLFNQMREDPVEIEREARIELSEAAAKFKTELETAVIDFNSFRRATVQSIAEGVDEIATKTATTLAKSINLYTETTTGVIGKINTAFTEFSDHSSKLNSIADRTVTATERLLERIEHIEAPTDLLDKKLTPMFGTLSASVQQTIERTKTETEQIVQFQRLIQSTSGSSQLLEERLVKLQTEGERQAETIGKELNLLQQALAGIQTSSAELLTTFRTGTEQQSKILHGLVKGAEEELAAVRMHRQALAEELDTSRKLVGEIHSSLVSMTSLVVDKLNGR